jgi:hypothetical protein
MLHRLSALIPAILLFVAAACEHAPNESGSRTAEPYIQNSNSVGFDIAPAPKTDSSTSAWLATYFAQGKVARFRIEFGQGQRHDSKDLKDFPITTGNGRFVAEPGSDPSVLLSDLKKALEAKTLPSRVTRTASLPFTFVSLGEDMSQAAGGGFNVTPPGHWVAIKIFLVEGEQEGEFFLNLNPVSKKGQFSIKDEDYGDFVLSQLAKVL